MVCFALTFLLEFNTIGILTLRVHISILVSNETTVKFDPNSVKFDIDVNQFPYSSPNNTRLALVIKYDFL
jgi:hypothetical protein